MSIQGPTNYTDFAGLASLRAGADKRDPEVVREVARQFESLFTSMMLKSMRQASLGDSLLDGKDSESYRDMFDQQIAVEMSRGRGLGIAEMLVRQLSGTLVRQSPEMKQPVVTPVPSATDPARDVPAAGDAGESGKPATTDEFVSAIWPHARRAARELGVNPRAIVAQAALETGWGKHMITAADGRSANNIFGIKADHQWHGDRISKSTVEFEDGSPGTRVADFRRYDSLEDGFRDYVRFLKNNPRYGQALSVGADSEAFAEGLQSAGYATDPGYAGKIRRILAGAHLAGALDALKNQPESPINSSDGRTTSEPSIHREAATSVGA